MSIAVLEWMTNLQIQHAKSPLPTLESLAAFEMLFYDPFEEHKADQELYNLRQGSTPIAKHILIFETLRVRSSRFSQGYSCVKEFLFSLNNTTQKRLNLYSRDKQFLLSDYDKLRNWLLKDAALKLRFSETPAPSVPAPVDDPIDLCQISHSSSRWTRMPEDV